MRFVFVDRSVKHDDMVFSEYSSIQGPCRLLRGAFSGDETILRNPILRRSIVFRIVFREESMNPYKVVGLNNSRTYERWRLGRLLGERGVY